MRIGAGKAIDTIEQCHSNEDPQERQMTPCVIAESTYNSKDDSRSSDSQ